MRDKILSEVNKQSDIVGPHNEGQHMIDLNRLSNILMDFELPIYEIRQTLIYNKDHIVSDSHALERIERSLRKVL